MIPRVLVAILTIASFWSTLFAQDAPSQRGTRVELRASVRLERDTLITLGAIAALAGEHAEQLRALPIRLDAASSGKSWTRLDASHVKAEILESGLSASEFVLTGGPTTIRYITTKQRDTKRQKSEHGDPSPDATHTTTKGTTVRHAVLERIRTAYGVDGDSIRITFASADAGVLDTSLQGRRIFVRPAASRGSARLPVQVSIYEDERKIRAATVTAEILLKQKVVKAAGTLERDAIITEADLKQSVAWRQPDDPRSAPLDEIVGSTPKRRIAAGVVITPRDLEPPIVIRRGDAVTVHCLSGSVRLTAPAVALHEARLGESVKLKLRDRKDAFVARVSARGLAVVDLGTGLGR